MTITVNNCVGCPTCINCGRKNEVIIKCDCCDSECDEPIRYNGQDWCLDCFRNEIIRTHYSNASKEEKERILSKVYNVGVTIRVDSVIYDDEPNELYNLYNVEEEAFNSMGEDELIEIFNL